MNLRDIFQKYWDEAVPLTQDVLDKYSEIITSVEITHSKAEKEIIDKIGLVEGETVKDHDRKKKPKSRVFAENFLRRYQQFLRNFEILREIYLSVDRRHMPEDKLPLRMEIDQFISWIREEKALRDSYINAPIREGMVLENFVGSNIDEFLANGYEYVDYVANYSYPTMQTNLSSRDTIESLTEEEIKDTVWIIHAFNAQLRFHHGGKDTLLEVFIADNGVDKIKKTFKYLLFGKGEYTQRMADCIFDPKYKLNHFGESCIQEIYGWANSEDIPLCNGRAFKSMQWLGFGEM
jgi:hypothetical protein